MEEAMQEIGVPMQELEEAMQDIGVPMREMELPYSGDVEAM